MLFRVQHLGPLSEAEVDLSKDLILLTGPYSTGKTYLAWSVFGLFRSRGAPKSFRTLLDEILASPTQEIGFERIQSIWPAVLEAVAENLASRLHLCFAAERKYFSNVRVSLTDSAELKAPTDNIARFSRVGKALIARIVVGPRVSISFLDDADRRTSSPSSIPTLTPELRLSLESSFSWAVLSAVWPTCTLLPAERTAVDLFAKELFNRRAEIVNEAVEAELEGTAPIALARRMGRYPWPIQDSLRLANDLIFYSRADSVFADLASELEGLMGGSMAVSEQGEFGFTPAGDSTVAIGIHLTSSVVKSLASLVFFLRHRARLGDLLMIDEPELNLHPDNQRKVTRVLAKAINRGLRVIMSTHSDYILRELNNLIILSRDDSAVKEIREKYQYDERELLSPDKVGAYLFKVGRKPEPIPVTTDGFEVQTIEDEINQMNQISQEIYAALL
ncbi:MAG: ATP-binding protein [Polyangiaceae bacterium]|nr:ATP-binding protein [Polyangiaceae bacterium]